MDPTPPDAYAPKDMEEAWLNHLSAFGEQDLDKILLDYTPSSVITLFERTTGAHPTQTRPSALSSALPSLLCRCVLPSLLCRCARVLLLTLPLFHQ